MKYVTINIGLLPIYMECLENGYVRINKLAHFVPCIDQPEEGVQAIISEEDIYIGADTVVEYDYAYDYKDMPELLAWLQSYNLGMPTFKKQQ